MIWIEIRWFRFCLWAASHYRTVFALALSLALALGLWVGLWFPFYVEG